MSQESFSEMEVLNMDFRIKVHFAQSVQICMFAEGKRSIYVVNLKNRSLFKIKYNNNNNNIAFFPKQVGVG